MKTSMIAGTVMVLIWAGSGGATLIDFESLADLEVVDNQFVTIGADFNASAMALASGVSLNELEFPPHSGSKLVTNDLGVSAGTLTVTAVGPLWTAVGGYVTGPSSVTLTAYGSGGIALGTDATGGANYVTAGTGLLPNIFLHVTSPGIAYVVLGASGDSYTLDDFTFSTGSPVPAPGAAILAGIGAAAVGWLRRGRRT